MFTGSYYNTIDSKGRALIPVKFRYSLGERVRLVRGVDACLYVFTQETWAAFEQKYINNLDLTDENARELQRFLLGGEHELEVDKVGRINLPKDSALYAGLDKEVAFVGCGDRVELWDAEIYLNKMKPGNLDPSKLMREAARASGGE